MAKNATWSVAQRNAKLDTIAADFDDGYLQLYDGAQPAGPGTPVTSQHLLAELRFASTAFDGAADGGVLTANPLTKDPSANMTGDATWFRCLKSDHATALHDGSVGTADANAIVANTHIVSGAEVTCEDFTITDAAVSAL